MPTSQTAPAPTPNSPRPGKRGPFFPNLLFGSVFPATAHPRARVEPRAVPEDRRSSL
ncbi:protein of unknown function [Bradyrhizobium vignae]|uniref:Uncharacterized protein n=1 Tax=Bradyrhizobium vignae TaxID=1549949 RepID=A0A2U3Q264_9BRAD|nr:protein of unknown function [Bradyrhizobium vignae]